MEKLVCRECEKVLSVEDGTETCPSCGGHNTYRFRNSDDFLKREVPRVREERKRLGLEGLTGKLRCVVVNVEPGNLERAAGEFLHQTGFSVSDAFENPGFRTVVLSARDSADILIRSRKGGNNPFLSVPGGQKSGGMPNTRLESFFFETPDADLYRKIQGERGITFLESEEVADDGLRFLQTAPSSYTGLSIGVVQGSRERGYRTSGPGTSPLRLNLRKPDHPHLADIGLLDHTATRVRALDRDAAIIEFMGLTGYDFDFAIYVKVFNSITNVALMSGMDFSMVFTSGIVPDDGSEGAGPTEKFIRNYGTRVHHIALRTRNIQETYRCLLKQGQKFMLELVGSPEEGLRQTFSEPSPSTMLVTELIERYGDFRGFFTRGNVTELTGATEGQ